ncbi:hypothetical protein NMG60_11014290 [Bertholletia excelsa]
MDYCLPLAKPYDLKSLPLAGKTSSKLSFEAIHRFISVERSSIPSFLGFSGERRFIRQVRNNRRAFIAIVGSAGASNCEFSSLNTPLEPKSPAGKFLTGVFQNDVECFHVAVGEQLERLVADREEAVARKKLSLGSDEACLNRRIAELKELECQMAIEDIMYMLILYKFNAIRVHLVPRLCRCVYNNRLEIWPSRDWELESIHSLEVLELIREHLTTVVGWRADSNVTDNWAPTEIPKLRLCQVYAASVLYGYFLKSASLRHHLELSLSETFSLPELWSCGLKNNSTAFDRIKTTQSASVRCYVMGLDPETLQMCAKPKTKEAVSLIERHSCALFENEKTGLVETDGVILTSLSSLKRMVLEAVAFGSFLWEAEEYVGAVYKLREN